MYTFLIKDNNTVEVFENNKEYPLLRQPSYPNGDPFDSHDDAESWAQLYISSLMSDEAPYPPVGKGQPGRAKPTKAEILEDLKQVAKSFGESVPESLANQIAHLEAQLS